MSVKSDSSEVCGSAVIQIKELTDIQLPSVFLSVFSFEDNQVKCKKCNITCKPVASTILFHVTVCKGSLIDEDIQTKFKMKCLLCNFSTGIVSEWKNHLFQLDHITRVFNSLNGFSYNCNTCETHFYGLDHAILEHECKPKKLSMFSGIMAYAYEIFHVWHRRMWYYCANCEHHTYELTDLHTTRDCKAAENAKIFVCESCSITFYDSSEKIFLEHKLTFEHMVLWCLNSDRKAPKTPAFTFPKLPSYMTKYFVKSAILKQCCCILCSDISYMSYDYIYSHYVKCIASKEISVINDCTPVQTINCDLCDYQYYAPEKNAYKFWVDHVISIEHLNKTKVKTENHKLYSYYCHITETIFYGTEYFIKKQIRLRDDEIGRLLFVSDVMTIAYKRLDVYFYCNTLLCCSFCLSYTDKPFKYCAHKNIDKTKQLSCSACMVEFNVESDYNEHFLSSEHVISKYFKPDKTKEKKFIDYCMATMKSYLSHLNESDDDDNVCKTVNLLFYSTADHKDLEFKHENYVKKKVPKNHKKLREQSSTRIVFKENITPGNSESNIISNLIHKLCASQPEKCAFNEHLRMSFELINKTPHTTNSFMKLKKFFCIACDMIFHDQESWKERDETCREKHNSIFYCAVCRIFHISTRNNTNDRDNTSSDISDHIKSVEHGVMVDFNEYIKKITTVPLINNNVVSTLTDNNQETSIMNEKEENTNYKENKNIYIEITGISNDYKVNNFFNLKTFLAKNYGTFKQISNQSKSFIILFRNKEQVKNMIEDKTKLEETNGFKIQVIGQNEENLLSPKTKDMLSCWPLFCNKVFNKLKTMELSLHSLAIHSDVKKLCDSVCSLNIVSNSINIHVFGSRLYGLATKNSDVDLYLEIDDTFDGELADNIDAQVNLVKLFAKQFLSNGKEFQNVTEVCDARVPIVKFYHIPTQLNCDVSFKSGLSLFNSKLICSYLSMDKTVKWLVCTIVKIWAPQNNLNNKDMFTSYALVWLVLFYLTDKKVMPSLAEILENVSKYDRRIIEGWECILPEWPDIHINHERQKLLLNFFQYYANMDKLKNHVLCTFTGTLIKKKKFFRIFSSSNKISEVQRSKFKTFHQRICSNFVKHNGLAIQDPFELSFNLTKKITGSTLVDFCELCDQSAEILINNTWKCV